MDLKLTPRFLLDDNFENRSKWDPHQFEEKTKKMIDDLHLAADYNRKSILENFRFYGGPEGAYDSLRDSNKEYYEEEQEIRKSRNEIYSIIRKATIDISPYAQTYRIPSRQVDKVIRNSAFEYYKVDLGMNINVPKGKINEVRFYLTIIGDGKTSEAAHVLSGFPNDLIERVTIVDGTIKVGINSLLDIVPDSIPQVISKFVKIDLNPWQIKWGYDKIKILFSKGNSHKVNWYLSSENLNRSFNCTITLKKRKTVKIVKGSAYACWIYDPNTRAKSILKKIFGKGKLTFGSDAKVINIVG